MPLSSEERAGIRLSREFITNLFLEYDRMSTLARQMLDSSPEIQIYQLALEQEFCSDEDYMDVLTEIVHGHIHWRISGYSSLRANAASVAEMTTRMLSSAAAALTTKATVTARAASQVAASAVASAAHAAASSATSAAYSAMSAARNRAIPAAVSFAGYLLGRSQHPMLAAPPARLDLHGSTTSPSARGSEFDLVGLPSPPLFNPAGFDPMSRIAPLSPSRVYTDLSLAEMPRSTDPMTIPHYVYGPPESPSPRSPSAPAPSISASHSGPIHSFHVSRGDLDSSRDLYDEFERIDAPPSPAHPQAHRGTLSDPRLVLFNAIIRHICVKHHQVFNTRFMSLSFLKCIKAYITIRKGNRQNVYEQLFLPPEVSHFIERQYTDSVDSASSVPSISGPPLPDPSSSGRAPSVASHTDTAVAKPPGLL